MSTVRTLFIVIAASVTQPSAFTCNKKLNNTFPDHGTEYCSILNTGTLTWSLAQGACYSLGYSLAVISSASEQSFIANNSVTLV